MDYNGCCLGVEEIVVDKLIKDQKKRESDKKIKGMRLKQMIRRRLDDYYEMLGEIRRGAFGAVYRARDKTTNEIVAMKALFHGTKRITSMMAEMNILRLLRGHPNIVEFKELVADAYGSIYITMEYVENDLHGLIYTAAPLLSAAKIKLMMKQLLQGVKFMHDNKVMHRDLKPCNILVNGKGVLKICDFGQSGRMGTGEYSLQVGTGPYRAPELNMKKEEYTEAVDMWAVGCIMAEMLLRMGGEAEAGEALHTIFWIVGLGESGYETLRREYFPAAVVDGAGFDLLRRLLSWEPVNRITAESALCHHWFEEEE